MNKIIFEHLKKSLSVLTKMQKQVKEIEKISNKSIVIDSSHTGNIQVMHKIIFHSICAYLDEKF